MIDGQSYNGEGGVIALVRLLCYMYILAQRFDAFWRGKKGGWGVR